MTDTRTQLRASLRMDDLVEMFLANRIDRLSAHAESRALGLPADEAEEAVEMMIEIAVSRKLAAELDKWAARIGAST